MKNIKVDIRMLKQNEDNPRKITKDKFRKLIASILCFPEMMSARPIVADENMVILGGNMRHLALIEIASNPDHFRRLSDLPDFRMLPEDKKQDVVRFWKDFTELNSKVDVIVLESLTSEQKRQFIIKDNAGFGDWDWDILANEWDAEQLSDWGIDIPNMKDEEDEKEEEEGNPVELCPHCGQPMKKG